MAELVIERAFGRFAMIRLPKDAPLPEWFQNASGFSAMVRTPDELSLMVRESDLGSGLTQVEGDWVGWFVCGPLAFEMVGVMARLSAALAEAGISLLAVSTFDTDWLFVKAAVQTAAERAWEASGFRVVDPGEFVE